MWLQPEALKRHVGHRHLQSTAKVKKPLLDFTVTYTSAPFHTPQVIGGGDKVGMYAGHSGASRRGHRHNPELRYSRVPTAVLERTAPASVSGPLPTPWLCAGKLLLTPVTCAVPPLSDSQASQSEERSLHLLSATVPRPGAGTEPASADRALPARHLEASPSLSSTEASLMLAQKPNSCSSSGIASVLFLFNGQRSETSGVVVRYMLAFTSSQGSCQCNLLLYITVPTVLPL